jgi:hypothetical protein
VKPGASQFCLLGISQTLCEFQKQFTLGKPYLVQQPLDFGYILRVQAFRPVHTLHKLIDIHAYLLKLRRVVLDFAVIHIYDIPIYCHFANIRADIVGMQKFHFLMYKSLFFRRYPYDKLNAPRPVLCHVSLPSLFVISFAPETPHMPLCHGFDSGVESPSTRTRFHHTEEKKCENDTLFLTPCLNTRG